MMQVRKFLKQKPYLRKQGARCIFINDDINKIIHKNFILSDTLYIPLFTCVFLPGKSASPGTINSMILQQLCTKT